MKQKKKKLPVYQYQVGRRTINISAINRSSAHKKAVKWRDKNAKHSPLSYNYRVD